METHRKPYFSKKKPNIFAPSAHPRSIKALKAALELFGAVPIPEEAGSSLRGDAKSFLPGHPTQNHQKPRFLVPKNLVFWR